MVLIDREISVERFDYWRTGADWALLELLTALPGAGDGPRPAHLLACWAGQLVHAPADAAGLERRLLGRAGSQLLCRSRFTLPLRAVDDPRTVFTLLQRDDTTVALAAPVLFDPEPRPLVLGAPRRARSAPLAGGRRRIAAAASAVAVTAGSTPAIALAARAQHQASGVVLAGGAPNVEPTKQHAEPPAATTTTTTSTSTTGTTTQPPPTTSTPAPTATPQPASTTTTTTTTAAPTPTPAPTTTTTLTSPTATPPPSAPCQSSTKREHRTRRAPREAQVVLGTATPSSPCRSTTGSHPGGSTTGTTGHRHRQHHPSSTHHGGGQHTATPVSSKPQPTSRKPSPSPSPTAGTSAPIPGTTAPTGGGQQPVGTLSPTPGFEGPQSWTGTVAANPTLTGVVRNLAGLLANGNRPPSFLIPIYMQAARRYHVPWPVLAAINAIESDYGRDLSTSTAGAVGWMQFEPSTWKEWGVAADGHSVPNPYDPRDAIFSAARYLQAAGAAQSITRAIYAYNHAGWYVDEVMSRAHAIAGHAQYVRSALSRRGTFSVFFATGLPKHPQVTYSGGVLSHFDRLIAAANMVSAANFPYLYGGGHEQPARFGPFDCSGSVSYVMQQAGYKVPTTVSGDIPGWRFPAGPGAVTIFYNPVHTFMRIGNRYFGTSGFARPGGGAGWFDVNRLPAGYLDTFREVHVPRLGIDSFAPDSQLVWPQPKRRSHTRTFPLFLPRVQFRVAQR